MPKLPFESFPQSGSFQRHQYLNIPTFYSFLDGSCQVLQWYFISFLEGFTTIFLPKLLMCFNPSIFSLFRHFQYSWAYFLSWVYGNLHVIKPLLLFSLFPPIFLFIYKRLSHIYCPVAIVHQTNNCQLILKKQPICELYC